MNSYYKITLFLWVLFAGFSCVKDLDQFPEKQFTSKNAYATLDGYRAVMSGIFFELSGNPDNTSSGIRGLFNLQELPTDEAVYSWPADNLDGVQTMTWTSQDIPIAGMFNSTYYNLALCNEFLRNATDEKIGRFSAEEQQIIQGFRNDVRFVRAILWLRMLDLYGGNIPFVTEKDNVGAFLPQPTTANDLFTYIEAELKEIAELLPDNGSNEYGRASKGAAYALLSRLYLNAETYIKMPKYTECIDACNKVFGQGFSIENDYQKLFNADNHKRTNEIIFPLTYDMTHSKVWTGTIYLIAGALGGSANPDDYGVTGAGKWGNLRAKPECFGFFDNHADKRLKFYKEGQSLEITTLSNQQDGYLVVKYNNLLDNGSAATGIEPSVAATDYPLIRLAEIYLNYAEAVLRGGQGGDRVAALNYVNQLRTRAAVNTINNNDLTLDGLLTERGRELYWECFRRTDLIRYNRFTGGDYIWSWKGNVKNGQATDKKYNLYPIPATEIVANPNLTQTTGY